MTTPLIAAGHDAAVVEVHHLGYGVYPGHNHEVVRGVPLARPVPDRFGIDNHDGPSLSGQILVYATKCENVAAAFGSHQIPDSRHGSKGRVMPAVAAKGGAGS